MWTDDCSVALPAGRSVNDVVELVLACRRKQLLYGTTIAELTAFGLSDEDAEPAIDLVLGGLVRASTGHDANEPSRTKDSLAHASHQCARADPSLIRLSGPFETD